MKKLVAHAWQILIWGTIAALFVCVDLNDYPIIKSVDYIFWPMCILFLTIALVCYWRHKACLILALLIFTSPVFAGEYTEEICSYYNSYKERIDQYRAEHFERDEKCDQGIYDKARVESAEYNISLNQDNTGSCANPLMTLCDEYRRRHPENSRTKTVPDILNEPVGNLDESGRATSCWPCDLAVVVFTVIQALSNSLSSIMATISFTFLIWATAFWLLYKAAGMVLTSKGGTYFRQIAGGLIAVVIASLILKDGGQNLSWLYSRFLSPVMEIGLIISNDIQSSVGADSQFYRQLEQASASSVSSETQFVDYCGYDSSSATSDDVAGWYSRMLAQAIPGMGSNFNLLTEEASRGQTLLTDELRSRFLCLTQKFYNQSRPFIATGESLVSFGYGGGDSIPFTQTRIPKNFSMWFIGIFFICIFTYFGFLVAFKIMDIFLRMGFILVLLPVFVVTTVFPITREYTVKAWTFLFQIIVEFIGLAIAASFVMIMLEGVLMPQSNELIRAMTAPYSSEYGENLLSVITNEKTLSFPLMLLCVVFLGDRLMRVFPMIIASLFGVPDSSNKGKRGTLMGGAITGLALQARGYYNKAKSTAATAAKNPYKTKETQAKEAEKDLREKEKKLKEEKSKPNNKKGIEKAQKDVDNAKKKADALRAQADAEKEKTAPSKSGYAARRFGYDSGNAIRTGTASAAEAIEKFGSKFGGGLTKYGGGLVGVPLTLGAKVVSKGIRVGGKTAEIGLKAAGRAGATVQKLSNKITGKAPPPPRP